MNTNQFDELESKMFFIFFTTALLGSITVGGLMGVHSKLDNMLNIIQKVDNESERLPTGRKLDK